MLLRACSMFGLGGLFLFISPKLREGVQESIGSVYMGVQLYAPYSYAVGVLLIAATLVISFNRGSQPR